MVEKGEEERRGEGRREESRRGEERRITNILL